MWPGHSGRKEKQRWARGASRTADIGIFLHLERDCESGGHSSTFKKENMVLSVKVETKTCLKGSTVPPHILKAQAVSEK